MREHGSTVAAHARAKLSAFYTWSLAMGIADSNPVVGTVQPEASRSRERVLSDRELTAIWRGCGDDPYGRVVRLLMLTGCRRQEVGDIAWDELDLPHGIWTIPGERTKNHKSHMLALPALALSMIEATPRMAERAHLFGTRVGGFCRWSQGKVELDVRCGVEGWTLHDLRRTVATRLADLGVQPHVVEQLLNHHSGHRSGIAGVYNRSAYEREARAALALWADHISALVEGRKRKVVSLRRAS
jgi:integrase